MTSQDCLTPDSQRATTLSEGEVQRIKLVSKLPRPPRGHSQRLLDEPARAR
ncbi:hypothetical protein ACH4TS_00230 [Streptomyces albidoflavus]